MDIDFSGVSKHYKVKDVTNGRSKLRDTLLPKYRIKEALNDVSFKVKKGEIAGYIGPNGAGKSTTIKIMSGILKPDSGTCRVLGMNPTENRIEFVRKIGVVFGNRSNLLWDLPVVDSFELMKTVYGITDELFHKNVEELVSMMDANAFIQTPVRQLSLGQRMRCEIIVSLLHSPEILFLDEPTLGLDAVSKIAVHQFIRKINREKDLTVILTTHDMGDIEALTQRLIMIGRGEKVYDGGIKEVRDKFHSFQKLTIKGSPTNQAAMKQKIEEMGWLLLQEFPGEWTIELDQRTVSIETVIKECSKVQSIEQYGVQPLSIEEIIARFYKELNV